MHAVFSRQSSRLFLPGNGLEVTVDLLLVLRWRIVVGAGGQPVFRLFGLKLPGQRRLRVLERLRRLPAQVFPLREVLLEGFRPWSAEHAALTFQGEAGPAARKARIIVPQLIDEVLGLLELPLVFLAQLAEVCAGAAASALLALSGLARLTGRFLRTRSLCAAPTAAAVLTGLSQLVQPLPQLLRARQLIGEFARLGILRAACGRELVSHLVQRPRQILLRAHLPARLLR